MIEPRGSWRNVPVEDGLQGFLNVFRRALGRPLATERCYVVEFGPITIPPGGEVRIGIPLPTELLEDEQ